MAISDLLRFIFFIFTKLTKGHTQLFFVHFDERGIVRMLFAQGSMNVRKLYYRIRYFVRDEHISVSEEKASFQYRTETMKGIIVWQSVKTCILGVKHTCFIDPKTRSKFLALGKHIDALQRNYVKKNSGKPSDVFLLYIL